MNHGYTQHMRKKLVLGMVLASLLLFSCSLSPEQEAYARTLELPDLRLTNATYRLDRGDNEPLSVTAAEISLYHATNKAIITNFTFTQTSADGTLLLLGKAQRAEVNLTTYDATLTGAIRVEKPSDMLVVEAEHLVWYHDEQHLLSVGEEMVSLQFEGNKTIRGVGMDIQLKDGSVSFTQLDEGVIFL